MGVRPDAGDTAGKGAQPSWFTYEQTDEPETLVDTEVRMPTHHFSGDNLKHRRAIPLK